MKINLSAEHLPEVLVTMIFFLPSLYYCLANLFMGFTFIYFICFICGGISYLLLIKKANTAFLVIFSLLIALCYTYFLNPYIGHYIFTVSSLTDFSKSRIVLLLLLYIPPFLIAISSPLDYEYLLTKLFWCSIIILPLDIIINIQRLTLTKVLDYMTISYQLLFWTMIALFYTIEKKKKWPWVIIIISGLSIFTGGSRGAVLCLSASIFLIYVCKNYLINKSSDHQIKQIILFAFLLIIAFIIFSSDSLILGIENLLSSFGLKSRVINRIIGASFFDNADRNHIQKELLPHVFNHIFGFGIYGDRFLTVSGKYAHNFFLELLIDFGVVLGGGVIIALIISTVKAFLICVRKRMIYSLYFVIFSIIYIYLKFMISASYLESSECFFAVGIVINIIRNRNNGELKDDQQLVNSNSILR